jgi:mannose/cellobiose epimerase-like protein (N-acyl-D-glucosamine 2-epimerase family)
MDKNVLEDHIKYILTFWREAVEFDGGGIHYQMDNYGNGVIRQNKKCLLMHARQLYDFSVGAQFNISDSQNVAEHLYNTLDLVFKRHDGIYQSFNESENPAETDNLSSYDMFYLVIGLSRFAKALKRKDAYSRAKEVYFKTVDFFKDGEINKKGCFANYSISQNRYFGKIGNATLHFLEATVDLIGCAKAMFESNELEKEVNDLSVYLGSVYELFTDKVYDKEKQVTYEFFNDDFTPSNEQIYGYATGAHCLEWFGFYLELNLLTNKKTDFLENQAKKLVDTAIERCVAKNGFLKNDYYLQENFALPRSSFWSQSEFILGLVYAHKYFSDEKYLNLADKMFEYYLENFIDKKFGGIFSDLYLIDGRTIIVNRSKGFSMKCDHHSLRMCEKIIENCYN